ncbi:MAG TPA: hypothetical protein VGQ84_02440 [Gaiellaceae bacterium]|jgi:hypothetical protein|nr:hypothetical protein [Gaiellaceae bacterium]
MNAAEPHIPSRGADLLLEHVTALEPADYPQRPAARERLERIVGGYLARLLVGALSGSRRPRRHDLD